MAEYIEREVLIPENLEKYMTVMEVNTREYGNQTVVAIDDLMYLPAADVKEVKHGKWTSNGLRNPQCSLCLNYNIEKSRFCPNCGARMDGERE